MYSLYKYIVKLNIVYCLNINIKSNVFFFLKSSTQCSVKQIKHRDYTQPLFEISVHAEDDRSCVQLTMDVGTAPGSNDVLEAFKLGGPSTILNEVLNKC